MNYQEILLTIISSVVTLIVIPLIAFAGKALINLINEKVKGKESARMLSSAIDIVMTTVKSVFQTYVETLKSQGKFDAEAQAIAFEKAKTAIIDQLSTEVKEFLNKEYGNFENWINTQIEASINTLKLLSK